MLDHKGMPHKICLLVRVQGDALACLIVNKLRGVVNVAAIKAPGFGERRKALLQVGFKNLILKCSGSNLAVLRHPL